MLNDKKKKSIKYDIRVGFIHDHIAFKIQKTMTGIS